MEPDNTNSNKISQPEEIQDEVNPLQNLLTRVLKDSQYRDAKFEILENNKISDALIDLIEPYVDEVENDHEFAMLLDVATIAWNLSFFSRKVAQQEIERMLQENKVILGDTEREVKETKEDLKNILGQMIARKKRHFSKYKRLIIDYELKNKGDGSELFVVSKPIKNKLK